MKRLWIGWALVMIALAVQAGISQRREVENPCFITANTSRIEIRKMILTDEHTQMDAVLYGVPGEAAVISSNTFLQAGSQMFRLREAEHLSIDGRTEPELIPKTGRIDVTLSFAPIPKGIHSVNFVEKEEGWKIWGIQLAGVEPYVYVPSFLGMETAFEDEVLPAPVLNPGRTVINGYILGYTPDMEMEVVFRHSDWLFPNDWGRTVKVRQDGSFHIEENLLLSGGARLQINQGQLDLFLTPGEELTIYVHLPRLSMAAARLLKHKYGGIRKAWFDGENESLNTELATWGYPLSIASEPDFAERTSEMSADDYGNYVRKRTEELQEAMAQRQELSQAYRDYVLTNLEISSYVLLAQKNCQVEPVDSPWLWYGYDWASYVDFLSRTDAGMPEIWRDILLVRPVCQSLAKHEELNSEAKKILKQLETPEIGQYVRMKADEMEAMAERNKAATGFVIAGLDASVSGTDILPSIISPHRGRAVLVEFWATWCGPCRKSMHAIQPLKESLAGKDVTFVYVAGPSSPEDVWKAAVPEIKGVHYRLTEKQWDDLCRSYGITGIPGYLIISYDGKLQDRYVGFPGTEILKKDLLRASE